MTKTDAETGRKTPKAESGRGRTLKIRQEEWEKARKLSTLLSYALADMREARKRGLLVSNHNGEFVRFRRKERGNKESPWIPCSVRVGGAVLLVRGYLDAEDEEKISKFKGSGANNLRFLETGTGFTEPTPEERRGLKAAGRIEAVEAALAGDLFEAVECAADEALEEFAENAYALGKNLETDETTWDEVRWMLTGRGPDGKLHKNAEAAVEGIRKLSNRMLKADPERTDWKDSVNWFARERGPLTDGEIGEAEEWFTGFVIPELIKIGV